MSAARVKPLGAQIALQHFLIPLEGIKQCKLMLELSIIYTKYITLLIQSLNQCILYDSSYKNSGFGSTILDLYVCSYENPKFMYLHQDFV